MLGCILRCIDTRSTRAQNRCQLTDPGGVSSEWEAQAKAGAVPASACKRSGHLLPPRARYVRRAGRVIVGFDHWCLWLGTPIGVRTCMHITPWGWGQ